MYSTVEVSRDEWEKLIAGYTEANFLQSWQYGDTQAALGHRITRRKIVQGDQTLGIFSAIIKNAKRGRFLEIAGGPLLDWQNEDLVSGLTRLIFDVAREYNCVFARFRPQSLDDSDLSVMLRLHGARLSPMHVTADHTSVIDLALGSDKILENMRQQTRYEVRRSAKRDIEITTDVSPAAIEEFYKLQAETAKRQGFLPPSKKYLSSLMENFAGHAVIYRASKNGHLLNLALVVEYGVEADYLEAASTADARREPGAYAIIWQAILDAKAKNLQRLNLWGIAPPEMPNHRYAGVTTFKQGFGGDTVSYLAPHDVVVQPLRYQLNHLIEIVRKKRRHL